MVEITVNTNETNWQESVDLPGAQVKTLGDGSADPTPAMLLRAPADWHMPAGAWHGAFHTTHGVTIVIIDEPQPGS